MGDLAGQWKDLLPDFVAGALVSVVLTVVVVVLSYPLGLVLGLAQLSSSRALKIVTRVVIELGRGVPALVTLYLVYFGLPEVGLRLSSFVAATCALTFTTAGYTSVVFEAGLKSVEAGQSEAAVSLGLNRWQTVVLVLLPQALRNVAPTLGAWVILVVQATSLAFTVAVPELMSRAYSVASSTYNFTAPLLLAALLYAAISLAAMALIAVALKLRSSRRSGRREIEQALAVAD